MSVIIILGSSNMSELYFLTHSLSQNHQVANQGLKVEPTGQNLAGSWREEVQRHEKPH